MNLIPLIEYLKIEIAPQELSELFDDYIFKINDMYALSGDAVTPSDYSGIIWHLKVLRDLFKEVSECN